MKVGNWQAGLSGNEASAGLSLGGPEIQRQAGSPGTSLSGNSFHHRSVVVGCGQKLHDSRVSPSQPFDVRPRSAMAGELVPRNYFRRFAREEISTLRRPLEIDLGCGDGSFLLAMASEFPDRDYIGVERLLGRVRKVCKKITRRTMSNVRVLRLDSKYTVEWLLPESSVTRLHLLCPDPWPKLRHQRRRLIQPEFLSAVYKSLVPGGEFLFMTDHEEYFSWAEMKTMEFEKFDRLTWMEESFFYPKTDFQMQWEAEGKPMFRMRFQKPNDEVLE